LGDAPGVRERHEDRSRHPRRCSRGPLGFLPEELAVGRGLSARRRQPSTRSAHRSHSSRCGASRR
jgi:hypothetical protein